MTTAYPPTFKVALIQMYCKPLDQETNFATAEKHIRQAAKDGASLAVLPEYHLTNWAPQDSTFAKIAANANDYIKRYQSLAAELKINIIPGTIVTAAPHLDPPANGSENTLVNISTFISYTGEILGSYTKTNLWHPERAHLTSSIQAVTAGRAEEERSNSRPEPHDIIETPLGPLGIVVCWDLAFPEAFRELVRRGAKIIIVPTFWMATDCSEEGLAYNKEAEALLTPDLQFLSSTLIARAYENTAAIIFVNAGGPASEGYCGLSQVAMPLVGTVKGSFTGPEAGMRIVDVDMDILEVAERNYKVREDLKRDDWHYGYSHGVQKGESRETNGTGARSQGALQLPPDRERPETAHKDENARWEKEIAKLPREEVLTQP